MVSAVNHGSFPRVATTSSPGLAGNPGRTAFDVIKTLSGGASRSFNLGSGGLSGLFGLLQTGLSGLITGIQNKKTRDWQEEQARIAYERQVEQWRREASYNSPAAQVARLRAAGINVNDAFSGQGAATAGGLSGGA